MCFPMRLGAALLLLVLAGCDVAVVAPVPAPPPATPLTQAELNERHAANFLKAGTDFRDRGDNENAIETWEVLIDTYPDTDAAKEAALLVKELQGQAETSDSESVRP